MDEMLKKEVDLYIKEARYKANDGRTTKYTRHILSSCADLLSVLLTRLEVTEELLNKVISKEDTK